MIEAAPKLAALACLAVSCLPHKGETHELFWPPFRFIVTPGANWAFAGLIFALLAIAS